VDDSAWIRGELDSGRTDYVERDVDGRVHFNGAFRNACELRAALDSDATVDPDAVARLCDVFEAVFEHHKFTGRSGSMYKYEGLGCIYWHMVSKLLLATGEVVAEAVDTGADPALIDALAARFRDIQAGLGVHKSPASYGAFPIDPYSHTPEFTGVQQPGLTGQVKEDVITRFRQLGVRVTRGEITFRPVLLSRDEFLHEPGSWCYSTGDLARSEPLARGSLAFTICGVPVVYRIADSARIRVVGADGTSTVVEGARLGPDFSRSLFGRDRRIAELIVDVPESSLR
jgi:hypothetical protein